MGKERLSSDPPALSAETRESGEAERESLLRNAFDRGRTEYGALPLTFEVFTGRALALAHRRLRVHGMESSPTRLGALLSSVVGPDLFLAIACEEGCPGAWETFTQRFVPRLFGLARRYGASTSEAEEIACSIPGDAASPPRVGEARTRLGMYDGSGPLLAWLSVQVARRIADRARARHTSPLEADEEEGGSEVEELREPSPAASDPAELLLDAETASRFGEGMRAAWSVLDPRETLAILLRFRDGLPLREIAPRLGNSDSQASRVVASAVEKIRTAVLRRFPADGPGGGEGLWAALRDAVWRQMQHASASSDSPHGSHSDDGRPL